jgi:hypothetical protein
LNRLPIKLLTRANHSVVNTPAVQRLPSIVGKLQAVNQNPDGVSLLHATQGHRAEHIRFAKSAEADKKNPTNAAL